MDTREIHQAPLLREIADLEILVELWRSRAEYLSLAINGDRSIGCTEADAENCVLTVCHYDGEPDRVYEEGPFMDCVDAALADDPEYKSIGRRLHEMRAALAATEQGGS